MSCSPQVRWKKSPLQCAPCTQGWQFQANILNSSRQHKSSSSGRRWRNYTRRYRSKLVPCFSCSFHTSSVYVVPLLHLIHVSFFLSRLSLFISSFFLSFFLASSSLSSFQSSSPSLSDLHNHKISCVPYVTCIVAHQQNFSHTWTHGYTYSPKSSYSLMTPTWTWQGNSSAWT